LSGIEMMSSPTPYERISARDSSGVVSVNRSSRPMAAPIALSCSTLVSACGPVMAYC
jgi:hypothetical protein